MCNLPCLPWYGCSCRGNIATAPLCLPFLSTPYPTTTTSHRYRELQTSEVTKAAAGLCPVPGAEDGCQANLLSGVWKPWLPDISETT